MRNQVEVFSSPTQPDVAPVEIEQEIEISGIGKNVQQCRTRLKKKKRHKTPGGQKPPDESKNPYQNQETARSRSVVRTRRDPP